MNFLGLDPRTFDGDQLAMTWAMTIVCCILWVMYWLRGKRIKRLEKQLAHSTVRVITDFKNGKPIRSESFPIEGDDGTLPLPLLRELSPEQINRAIELRRELERQAWKRPEPPSTRITDTRDER